MKEQYDAIYRRGALFKQKIEELLNREESQKDSLYIVPTPIGNLADISLRALAILSEADVIACEDTRNTASLLNKLGIEKPILIRSDSYSEAKVSQNILEHIRKGNKVALVSDAGLPLISDPGHILIERLLEEKINVVVLPGSTASLPALIGSGLDASKFYFAGFIPSKKNRQSFLKDIFSRQETSIFYESPNRLKKLADELYSLGEARRKVVVARELSKKYEEFIRSEIGDLATLLETREIKGELVIVVEGLSSFARRGKSTLECTGLSEDIATNGNEWQQDDSDKVAAVDVENIREQDEFIKKLILEGLSNKEILRKYKESSLYRNEKRGDIYKLIMDLKNENERRE